MQAHRSTAPPQAASVVSLGLSLVAIAVLHRGGVLAGDRRSTPGLPRVGGLTRCSWPCSPGPDWRCRPGSPSAPPSPCSPASPAPLGRSCALLADHLTPLLVRRAARRRDRHLDRVRGAASGRGGGHGRRPHPAGRPRPRRPGRALELVTQPLPSERVQPHGTAPTRAAGARRPASTGRPDRRAVTPAPARRSGPTPRRCPARDSARHRSPGPATARRPPPAPREAAAALASWEPGLPADPAGSRPRRGRRTAARAVAPTRQQRPSTPSRSAAATACGRSPSAISAPLATDAEVARAWPRVVCRQPRGHRRRPRPHPPRHAARPASRRRPPMTPS